ncbi:hypothetical protein OEJ37_07070 [Burkholderia sp. BKH01]|uniref:hypothetical protein n=1 Tax=Burkholderia sp. BKH01 TaxID=2769262 RepID=UPI0021E06352|nr:hypothetical protein [Burkholderia sp. BKH01]MCU9953121.1 hypothetical protein [Burkholderia sp. BKH01]
MSNMARYKKSLRARAFALLMLCILPCASFSQTESTRPVRPATRLDIEGAWKLIAIPPELQPKILGGDPWPSECQLFAYRKDGVFKSLSRITGSCPPISAAQIEATGLLSPADIPDVRWEFGISKPTGESYIVISRLVDGKPYHEVWQAGFVQHDVQIGEENYRQGDLLLVLVDPKTSKTLWYRHLRRVN